jgi:hypothetical protein
LSDDARKARKAQKDLAAQETKLRLRLGC